MNSAHFHLLVNHVSFFSLIIAMVALGISMKRKSGEFRVFASGLFLVAGLFVWIAFLTGEGAEDVLKGLGAYPHDFIEQHEQAAKWARLSGTWVAFLALAMEWAIFKNGRKLAKGLQWALLVFGLHGCAVYLATSYLGGQITHAEFRPVEPTQPVD